MRFIKLVFIVVFLLALNACAVRTLPSNIPYGILNNDDLATVEAGLPTYLLLLDGILESYPESESLLSAASSLNGAYAGVFVKEEVRAKRLTNKSLAYAQRAMCAHNKKACALKTDKFADFERVIKGMKKQQDVSALYTLGTAWASYIQLNTSDWSAIADLAKVQRIMEQSVAIDETFEHGMGHLYLGVLASILPPALGGKPDVAKAHYEKAIALSEGKNLVVKLMYAQQYARLIYDRELHDRLLKEVLAADPHVYGLTLQNVYAQQEAQSLLLSAEEYF